MFCLRSSSDSKLQSKYYNFSLPHCGLNTHPYNNPSDQSLSSESHCLLRLPPPLALIRTSKWSISPDETALLSAELTVVSAKALHRLKLSKLHLSNLVYTRGAGTFLLIVLHSVALILLVGWPWLRQIRLSTHFMDGSFDQRQPQRTLNPRVLSSNTKHDNKSLYSPHWLVWFVFTFCFDFHFGAHFTFLIFPLCLVCSSCFTGQSGCHTPFHLFPVPAVTAAAASPINPSLCSLLSAHYIV